LDSTTTSSTATATHDRGSSEDTSLFTSSFYPDNEYYDEEGHTTRQQHHSYITRRYFLFEPFDPNIVGSSNNKDTIPTTSTNNGRRKPLSFHSTSRRLPKSSSTSHKTHSVLNRAKQQRNSSHLIVLIVQHQRVIIILATLFLVTLTGTTITKFHQMVMEHTNNSLYHNTSGGLVVVPNNSSPIRKKKLTRKKRDEQDLTMVDKTQILAKLLGIDKPLSNVSWHDLHFDQEQTLAPLCGDGTTTTTLHPSNISFTLVTQVSEDRLWMLTQHCHRWPGPISAAVFTDYSVAKIQQIITTENGAYGRCQPDQVTVTTLIKTGIPDGEYPVNALRNLALRGVRTTHLFYADVDFWSSDNLYETLLSQPVTERLSKDDKLALVVPAFQMKRHCDDQGTTREASILCRLSNMASMPKTKHDILGMVHAMNATAFDPTNKGGHGSTRYAEWYLQQEGELHDIPCISSNRYEPYVAVRYCRFLPPFQEVFTGYGKNKMTVRFQIVF
jgi:hypothetical protein